MTVLANPLHERDQFEAVQSVYLDHAATTPFDPRVVDAMRPYWFETFGNPSSMYRLARDARRAVDDARDLVGTVLGARASEIIFTSSGSESDNAALKGIAFAHRLTGHIITTSIEHHAVLHSCEFLETLGMRVTYLPVDGDGLVDPDDVGRAIRDETILVSVMYANNEIGTIEPIEEIGRITRAKRIPFHVDAVQAAGSLDLLVDRLGVDLLSLSGHKMYGPKGVGILFARRGLALWPYMHGGGQERGRRAGTENVAGIVGFATALGIATGEQESRCQSVSSLRDAAVDEILSTIEGSYLTGHATRRLPNHASFVFDGVSGESLLLALDQRGIMVSTGSACTSGSLDPSHVLLAIGLAPSLADGSLRLTFGHHNTTKDVDILLKHLRQIVVRLREHSLN